MEATNTINVALCQIFCLDGDRAGNFVRMENALALSAHAADSGRLYLCHMASKWGI